MYQIVEQFPFYQTEKRREALDSSDFACGIFIDLQKTFYTADQQILLTKLNYYPIKRHS